MFKTGKTLERQLLLCMVAQRPCVYTVSLSHTYTHTHTQHSRLSISPTKNRSRFPLPRLPTSANLLTLQFDWLVREKIADGPLISKWRKPGYNILCSMLAIQKNNHNFGTTSHCRVPMKQRGAQQRITPDVQTGCICCASGDGKYGGPIWWNTPMDGEEEPAQANRATWTQAGQAGAEEGVAGPSEPVEPPGQKRVYTEGPGQDEDEELDPQVKRRLAALQGI
jgi:hypothetical protein